MELQVLLAFLYYHTTLFYVIWIWSTLHFSEYLNIVRAFGAPSYFPRTLVPEFKKESSFGYVVTILPVLFIYALKNMNHLSFVCP
jgi:hypothetical protein